MVFNLRKK